MSLAEIMLDVVERGINITLPFGTNLTPCSMDGDNPNSVDQADNFQAILNYASTNNLIVYIPKGTLKLQKNVSIPSNLVIIGGDVQKTIIKFFANASLKLLPSANGYVYQTKMYNLTIDGNNLSTLLVDGFSVAGLVGLEECLFENVWIVNATAGFKFKGLNLTNFVRCSSGYVGTVFDLVDCFHNNVLYGNFYESIKVFLIENTITHLSVDYTWCEAFDEVLHVESHNPTLDIGKIQFSKNHLLSVRTTGSLMKIDNISGGEGIIRSINFRDNSIFLQNMTGIYLIEFLNDIPNSSAYIQFTDNVVNIPTSAFIIKSSFIDYFRLRAKVVDNVYYNFTIGGRLTGQGTLLGIDSMSPDNPLSTVVVKNSGETAL
jgi:hypothetical protein